jgi:hypothetical protein
MTKVQGPKQRFDHLLQAMASQPEPSRKQQGDNQTSDKESGAGYGDSHWDELRVEQLSSQRSKP